jgi:hypothetical protein
MRRMRNIYPFCTLRHSKFLWDYLRGFRVPGAGGNRTPAE